MPDRAPGGPEQKRPGHLSGTPARDCRPGGSAGVRALIEDGFERLVDRRGELVAARRREATQVTRAT